MNVGTIVGLLGVLFVGLKLTGHITWSWLWVTAPFWGGLALAATILLVGSLYIGIGVGLALLSNWLDR